MSIFRKRMVNSPLSLLLLAALTIFGAGCGKPGPKGDGVIPDLTGTWVSPKEVDPNVEFTINNLLSQVSLNGETYHYYSGTVTCSVLRDGEVEITKAPTHPDQDGIIVTDSYWDTISIRAGFSTVSSGQVLLEGRALGGSLACRVKIFDKSGEVVYETKGSRYDDIFERKSTL